MPLFARRNPTSTETMSTTITNTTTITNPLTLLPPPAEEGNKSIPLSFDHKPDDNAETKQTGVAGGYVSVGRVAAVVDLSAPLSP